MKKPFPLFLFPIEEQIRDVREALKDLYLPDVLVDEYLDRLERRLKVLHFTKKATLLDIDELAGSLYYIYQGAAFYVKEEADRNKINKILWKGDFIHPVSFFSGEISKKRIDVDEGTIVVCLEWQDYEELEEDYPMITQELIERWEKRIEDRDARFQTECEGKTTKEKVVWLMNELNNLLFMISNRQLANFLGVTERTISRVKRAILRKE